MDWTLAPLVALVLCDPTPQPGTDEMRCLHYQSLPYVSCMRRADVMRERRRSENSPLPACIRLDAVRPSASAKAPGGAS